MLVPKLWWNGLRRYFALLIILAGLGLISLAGFMLFKTTLHQEQETRLPASIAGMSLLNSQEGEQALTALAQMHGKEFPLIDGWIGSYGKEFQVTVWVAISADIPSSGRLLQSMREKIAQDQTPFTPVGERKEGNRSIYELNGMGQEHFYFQSGKLLVWLAADQEIAQEAIQETLEFYPEQ